MPNLSHIEAFLEAAETGSFLLASENLNVSASAVSIRIKVLEEAVGQQLFERERHGVRLTACGEVFLPFAETCVTAWQNGKQATDLHAKGKKHATIGIQQDIWECFGAEWFGEISKTRPEMTLSVVSDYTDALCAQVRQNLLDFAIIFRPRRLAGVQAEFMTRLELAMVADRPLRWSGILPDDYIQIDWGPEYLAWHKQEFGTSPTASLTASVSSVALSSIGRSGGASHVLLKSASQTVEQGNLHLAQGAPRFEIEVWCVSPLHDEKERSLTGFSKAIHDAKAEFVALAKTQKS